MEGPPGKVGKECYLDLEFRAVTQVPEGRETVGHAGIWEMSISHKGSSKDWDPEMGLLRGCLRKTV